VVAVVNGYPIGTVGTDMRSKYPNVCVTLIGEDENAFAIVERLQRALREVGVPTAEGRLWRRLGDDANVTVPASSKIP
jgi:hypothetical protein